MSTIILWNDEKKRYEKWVVKRNDVEIIGIGDDK